MTVQMHRFIGEDDPRNDEDDPRSYSINPPHPDEEHPENYRLRRTATQRQVVDRLGVTHMTLWLWRKQSNDPFPCHMAPAGQAHHVHFDPVEIYDWIKRNRPALMPRALMLAAPATERVAD